jgi:hypothetical protein
MLNRVLIYAFPFILLVIEWVLRVSLVIDSREFVGPTIAAAALGLLLPLTGLKQREHSEDAKRFLSTVNAVLVPKWEQRLIQVVWLFILATLALWACCVVFAFKPERNLTGLSPVYCAMAAYFVAVIASEIREAL